MENFNSNDIEQSAWNLSQYIINQIGNLLQSASTKFRNGNIQGAYWDTEEIRTLICAHLDKEENKKLDKWETTISNLNSMNKKYLGIIQGKELEEEQRARYRRSKLDHYREVKNYRMYMMVLLSKYGYSVSKKEDRGKMF